MSVCPSVCPSSLSCTGDISKTGRPRHLILVPMESSRPVDVPFGTFGQFRPIGHGQIGRNWPKIGVSCTGDISKTGRPRHLMLVPMESSRPVDVPFGTFNLIRPIGHGQIGQKSGFSIIEFVRAISRKRGGLYI